MTLSKEQPDPTKGPPLNAVWATLRRKWLLAGEGRSNNQLTELVSSRLEHAYTAQSVSQWATGTDARRPPWRAIFLLMQELGLEMRLRGDGSCELIPAAK